MCVYHRLTHTRTHTTCEWFTWMKHTEGWERNVPVVDVDFKHVDEPLKLGIGSPYFGKGHSKCKIFFDPINFKFEIPNGQNSNLRMCDGSKK